MRTLIISIILMPIGMMMSSCGLQSAKALEPAEIECKILNAWDFKRCENAEVICYTNDNGLSCKWKK